VSTAAAPRHRRTRRLALAAVQAVVVVVVLALLAGRLVLGLALHPVLSDSMRPAFGAGDRLVVVDHDGTDLRAGDVPLLRLPDGTTRAHRVVQVVRDGGGTVQVLTRGDANAAADTWVDLRPGARVPVVLAVLPDLPGPAGADLRLPSAREVAAVLLALLGTTVTALLVRRQLRRAAGPCPRCEETTAPTTTKAQTQPLEEIR